MKKVGKKNLRWFLNKKAFFRQKKIFELLQLYALSRDSSIKLFQIAFINFNDTGPCDATFHYIER